MKQLQQKEGQLYIDDNEHNVFKDVQSLEQSIQSHNNRIVTLLLCCSSHGIKLSSMILKKIIAPFVYNSDINKVKQHYQYLIKDPTIYKQDYEDYNFEDNTIVDKDPLTLNNVRYTNYVAYETLKQEIGEQKYYLNQLYKQKKAIKRRLLEMESSICHYEEMEKQCSLYHPSKTNKRNDNNNGNDDDDDDDDNNNDKSIKGLQKKR